MHWQTYKSLTKKQKEEYDFRFKDKLYYPNFTSSARWALVFVAMITLNVFVIYLAMTDPMFESLKEQVTSLFTGTYTLAKWGLIFIIIDLGWNGVNMGIQFYQEYKWCKKEKIVHKSPLNNWMRGKGWLK